MPRKIEKKEREVFEKEPGSDIWWVRYYIDGRERREGGRRGDAIKLYKVRKSYFPSHTPYGFTVAAPVAYNRLIPRYLRTWPQRRRRRAGL